MSFSERFITKLGQQIHSQNVGFLLGAGSSYLDGQGYPLTAGLWDAVKPALSPADRNEIQSQIDNGCLGLEEALDRLDDGAQGDFELRHRVASAVARQFGTLSPPLTCHRMLARGLSRRRERRVPIFSLNYDPLIERAADKESLLLMDGFWGSSKAFFHPNCFDYRLGLPGRRRGRAVVGPIRGIINLYKLHGSMGWYLEPGGCIRRREPESPVPDGARLLMIPPHQRKAQDTGFPPYSTLWSEFRGLLTNDKTRLLNRLVCVGYRMRDTHVNPILEAARARPDFTLVILTRNLADEEFNYWKKYENVIIATHARCALYGEEGSVISEAWSFEWLAKEVGCNA